MPAWELTQALLGMAVVPLIAAHVAATAGLHSTFSLEADYVRIVLGISLSWPAVIQQCVLTVVVWLHVCFGLHFWLRLKSWYPRWVPLLYAGAILVPVLTLIGFARARDQALELAADSTVRDNILSGFGDIAVALALVLAVLAARAVRLARQRANQTVILRMDRPGSEYASRPVHS